ncbi:MAG: dihydrolipoyl dehydrogenase [Spirochaetes bacterium GWD1_27_9]|nr:MAG: dihydrolipoyl dehydrogenase [Spirochaetes bacterium GWB1_27_13]OHD20009.1 MAG: dihydrolipoyl dehydrogenase [Spirochaetes bacterium GWC1_27_15]OHD44454.1 MAG: dihydrolipoyl dehydrogenase [Spirochaetes bacterium GWD1_27_9]
MDYDVIVIGSGPAGYTAACLFAKNNLKTLVVEKDKVGGVCLNVGCIPTKTLLTIAENYSLIKENEITGVSCTDVNIDKTKISQKVLEVSQNMSKSIDYLFKKNGVTIVLGDANFIDKNTISVNGVNYSAKFIIIATGSRNKDYSNFLDANIPKDKIITSTEALFLENIPKSITILGAGAIGVEFAYIYSSFGSEVTLIEYFPHILPNMDEECGKTLERSFKKKNIKVITDAKVSKINYESENYVVNYTRKEKDEKITSEYVLFAMGRTPNSNINGIEKLNLEMEKTFIKVNKSMQTSVENIYAIGDIIAAKPLLAHVAYDEARVCVDNILNIDEKFDINYKFVPFCIYTEPQIASFGFTEKEAKEKGYDFKVLKSFFKASGKAMAMNKQDGFVKILVENQGQKIIGASIVGANATEIIHEILICAKNNLNIKDLSHTMHAHPTLSELISDTAKIYWNGNLH